MAYNSLLLKRRKEIHENIGKAIEEIYRDRLERHFHLGEFYANNGRKDEALINLNKVLSMCQEMGIEYWPDKVQEIFDRL